MARPGAAQGPGGRGQQRHDAGQDEQRSSPRWRARSAAWSAAPATSDDHDGAEAGGQPAVALQDGVERQRCQQHGHCCSDADAAGSLPRAVRCRSPDRPSCPWSPTSISAARGSRCQAFGSGVPASMVVTCQPALRRTAAAAAVSAAARAAGPGGGRRPVLLAAPLCPLAALAALRGGRDRGCAASGLAAAPGCLLTGSPETAAVRVARGRGAGAPAPRQPRWQRRAATRCPGCPRSGRRPAGCASAVDSLPITAMITPAPDTLSSLNDAVQGRALDGRITASASSSLSSKKGPRPDHRRCR